MANPEGEEFVAAFVDGIKTNADRRRAREILGRDALEALRWPELEDPHNDEKMDAITDELAAFNEERADLLSAMVDGRFVTVRDLSPGNLDSVIIPSDVDIDPRRRPRVITGSQVEIMDALKGFRALSLLPIPQPLEGAESMTLDGSNAQPTTNPASHFEVKDIVQWVHGGKEVKPIPRISVDIHDEPLVPQD